jgi:hypothetical protein
MNSTVCASRTYVIGLASKNIDDCTQPRPSPFTVAACTLTLLHRREQARHLSKVAYYVSHHTIVRTTLSKFQIHKNQLRGPHSIHHHGLPH